MKRRGGFTWVEMAIILVTIAILTAVLLPALMRNRNPEPNRRHCASNLKQIGLSFMMYAQENDEQMPLVKMSDVQISKNRAADGYKPFGWADAIWIYAKDDKLFQCPSQAQNDVVSDPTQKNYTDYWYNTNLSNLKLEKLIAPAL